MVTYACRYFSGHLIPIIQSCQNELVIKCPPEYLQVLVATVVSLLFISMIPIDYKFFPYNCIYRHNDINIDCMQKCNAYFIDKLPF